MDIQLTDTFQFLFKPKSFKILCGGRYGMKTTAAVKSLLVQGAQQKLRILGCREYMKSIDSSVHEAMTSEIEKMSMTHLYDVYKTSINGTTGTKIRYSGLSRDPKGIKSTWELDRALLEEGESVSEKSLDDLIPTIIREPGSELWIVFNPEDELSPVWQRFVAPYIDKIKASQYQSNRFKHIKPDGTIEYRETEDMRSCGGFYEDDRTYVCFINYWENPFLSDEAWEEAETVKKENYKKWLWQYAGELYTDYHDSIIKPEWIEAAIDSHIKLGWKPLGVKSTGFDLADTGDAKALYHRHGSLIYDSSTWEWGELPEAIDKAFDDCRGNSVDYQVYDDDGMGKSMKVYLANTEKPSVKIVSFNGNASVDNPKSVYFEEKLSDGTIRKITNEQYFKNKRAQYYGYLRDRFEATYNAIEKGVYTDPNDMISISKSLPNLNVLKSQLTKIKKVRGNNTLFQVQSKKDAIKEGVKSQNDADALMMSFANPEVVKRKQEFVPMQSINMPLAK
jgi:phage terminase large subunit